MWCSIRSWIQPLVLLPQNFKFDIDSANFVFEHCQKFGVSLVVLTRSAAYAASVPAFIYDELAALGHPVALRLRESQLKAITSLWHRTGLPHDDKVGCSGGFGVVGWGGVTIMAS